MLTKELADAKKREKELTLRGARLFPALSSFLRDYQAPPGSDSRFRLLEQAQEHILELTSVLS